MSTEDNKALARRLFEEVWNEGNLALIDELFAPNFLFHDPDDPQVRTLEDYKRLITEFRSAFPDGHHTIDEMIAAGDQVVVRWTYSGTQQGAFQGIPPTGKQVEFTGISIIRFEEDKFGSTWLQSDTLTFLQQLGVIPKLG
jgi:steroid delta-isomerase-like uncharacterized protein